MRIAFVAVIIALFCGIISLLLSNSNLKQYLAGLEQANDRQLENKLVQAQEGVRREVEEEFADQALSYAVTAKRLQLERERLKELEGRLNEK